MDLMFGAHFAKQYVNNYLKTDIPVRIINYRNGWNLDDVVLPTPVSFFTYEPIALDSWPTIITVAMSTNNMERIGYEKANPLYRVNYSMRTYVWVRDVGSEEATIMRDRLTTVVRSAILDYPCMKATDPQNTFKAMIDESSIQEQFSDLTLLKGDRVMAGAYLSYDLSIDEVVDRLPLGTISSIDLELSTLDRTP
jgi:hypothetical protein